MKAIHNLQRIISTLFSRYKNAFSKSNIFGKIGIGCGTLLLFFCSCSLGLLLLPTPDSSDDTNLTTQNDADSAVVVSNLTSSNEADDDESDVATEENTPLPSPTSTQFATETPEPTETSEPTATASSTETMEPTATIEPSNTPTRTPRPTNTAVPNTATPIPSPVPSNTPVPPTAVPPTATTAVIVATAVPTQAPTEAPPAAPPLPPASFNNCQPDPNPSAAPNYPIRITNIDKGAETVTLLNVSNEAIDLGGWRMCSIKGNQEHTIGGVLAAGAQQTFPHNGGNIWNNGQKDDGALYNNNGQLVSYWND